MYSEWKKTHGVFAFYSTDNCWQSKWHRTKSARRGGEWFKWTDEQNCVVISSGFSGGSVIQFGDKNCILTAIRLSNVVSVIWMVMLSNFRFDSLYHVCCTLLVIQTKKDRTRSLDFDGLYSSSMKKLKYHNAESCVYRNQIYWIFLPS